MASGAVAAGRVRNTIDRRMNLVQRRLVWTFLALLGTCLVVALGTGIDAGSAAGASSPGKTCAWSQDAWHICARTSLKFFGISLGVLAASGAVGGFLGFLFGVPRLMQRVNRIEAAPGTEQKFTNLGAGKTSRSVAANSNLEEISDWLTKIIVGVALVQAREIGAYGRKIVDFLAQFGGTDDHLAKAYFACLIVTSFIICFLAIYLEARTRLTAMLSDMEYLLDNGLDGDLTKDANDRDIIGSHEGPGLPRDAASPTDVDRQLADVAFETLSEPEEFAAWGSAQARLKNFQAAARAMTEATTRASDNVVYLLRLADIRRLQGNISLELDALEEARDKRPHDPKIFNRLILVLLYSTAPRGFTKAITRLETAFESKASSTDEVLQLYYAAAQGQRATWLRENSSEKNSEELFTDARTKALDAAKRVKALTEGKGTVYADLKAMLYAKDGDIDDDLEIFTKDADFTSLVPQDVPAPAEGG